MNQYRYKCPTKGCEIDTILVNVHEDVIEYFGFCCPFCQDHMVRDDTHQSERDKVLELLEDLRKYANGEYKEADLSDNEHDLRIHLEYENRIWGIMKELRPAGR